MMRNITHFILLILLFCLNTATARAQCLTVEKPANNTLVAVTGAEVHIEGTATLGPVTVQVDNQTSYTATSIGDKWSVNAYVPFDKASLVAISAWGCEQPTSIVLLLTPVASTNVPRREHAAFGMEWTTAAEELLKDLGRATLDSPPPANFLDRVRRGILTVASAYLAEFDISLKEGAAPNRIRVVDETEPRGRFGVTLDPEDCGDQLQNASIYAYIGSLAEHIRANPPLWAILDKEKDNSDLRADDFGHLLGTVIAHEILHATGLLVCPWMQGYDGHNDPKFLLGHMGKRYGNGFHLMDPFERVPPTMLIGRDDSSFPARRLLLHDTFSKSYLSLVHPRP